jgi:hypothetical protein
MLIKITVFAVTIVCSGSNAMAFQQPTISKSDSDTDICNFWRSRIDPKIKVSGRTSSDSLKLTEGSLSQLKIAEPEKYSEEEIFKGIECLLSLEGNKNDSKIIGATSVYTSQIFGPSTIETAALYYISYLYYRKWDHALAARLVSGKGLVEDDETIHNAYEAYRAWYKKLKEVGIAKSKEMGLDPLNGSGIAWYGDPPMRR